MRFYGQFKNPSVDEYLYREFFRNRVGGFFIECGAANGIADSSCKFFEEFMGWTGINVEAHPGLFKELVRNRPKSINVNKALTSPEEEGKVLKFNSYDFKKKDKVLIDKFGPHAPIGYLDSAVKHREGTEVINLEDAGKLEVVGITFSSLVKDYGITNIDVFVLDVEGSELDAIEGMINCRVLPKVFCIETNKIDREKLTLSLNRLNYKYHSDIYVNSFYVLDE